MHRFAAFALGLLLLGPVAAFGQPFFPEPLEAELLDQPPYSSVGYLTTALGGFEFRGSATVARDERLLYTCAHVLYEKGRWADRLEFARAWHDTEDPLSEDAVLARGYRVFTTYSGRANKRDFALDFTVAYAPAGESFGPALPVLDDATVLARSDVEKLILGYPHTLDATRASGFSFQHQTGPFTTRLFPELGAYHYADRISTGSGNSGGPLLLDHEDKLHLGGILVSGNRHSIGVYVLDLAAHHLATNALATASAGLSLEPFTATFSQSRSLTLPDGRARYARRPLAVRRMPTLTRAVSLDLNITTAAPGELDVYLRSPRGRVAWLHEADPDSSAPPNLVLTALDLTPDYAGTNPNGRWLLFMRDTVPGNRATFQAASLHITAD